MRTRIRQFLHMNEEHTDVLLGTAVVVGFLAEIYALMWFVSVIKN